MGSTLFRGVDVLKKNNSIKVFFAKMALRRGAFAGGEKEGNGRTRAATDGLVVVSKPSDKRPSSCLELVRGAIPCLVDSAHKGQLGRIGVIGGCQE